MLTKKGRTRKEPDEQKWSSKKFEGNELATKTSDLTFKNWFSTSMDVENQFLNVSLISKNGSI